MDRERDEKRRAVPGVTMAAICFFGGGEFLVVHRDRETPPLGSRPCLNCGAPKQHNNSFCSAACCKEHRAKSKGGSP